MPSKHAVLCLIKHHAERKREQEQEMTRDSEKLKGYKTEGNRIKIEIFACDHIFLTKRTGCNKEILAAHRKHAKASGIEINDEKTEMFKFYEHRRGDDD